MLASLQLAVVIAYSQPYYLRRYQVESGSWTAFWLMPATNAYGNWPKSGEVDILEHIGNNFGKAMCAVHVENKNWTNGGNLGGNEIIPDVDTVYHIYGVEWSPDSLRFTHDGVGFYTYVNPQTDWKDWPFDKPFYVILNIAIGGGMGGNIVEADWPDSMLVDWVHISQKGLGTPVLDSIAITPADLSVLPGKTQQFTAKILDQNSHAMTGITPAWSITGSGNTINAAGVATIQSSGVVTATATYDSITVSGNTHVNVRATNYKPVQPAALSSLAWSVNGTGNTIDSTGLVTVNAAPGLYLVIATTGTLADTAWVNITECTVNTKYEAESFSARHSGPVLETCTDLGGGQNFTGLAAGHYFAYNTLNVPTAGLYRISFRVSSTAPAQIKTGLRSIIAAQARDRCRRGTCCLAQEAILKQRKMNLHQRPVFPQILPMEIS